MWSYRESIRLFLNLAWMEPGVLRQTLGISRFIGGAECVLRSYEFSTNFAPTLYLERQFNSNLSTCLVHGKYVFFTNFMQIRLR